MSAKINRDNLPEEIVRRFYENRFGKDMSEEIRDDFFNWLANDQDAERKLNILEELCQEELKSSRGNEQPDKSKFLQLLGELEIRGSYPGQSQIEPTGYKRERIPLRRVMMRVAVVVIPLMVIATGVIMFDRHQPINADYATAYGESKSVELLDGTGIEINACSELITTMDKKQRLAKLSGEAFFEVVKDDKRPFVVKTDNLTVTVTGTAFNVSAYPDSDEVIVTLKRGSVSVVTPGDKLYKLEPNQQLVFDRRTGKELVRSLETDKTLTLSGWKDGMFVAQEMALMDVLRSVGRHYGVGIEIEGEPLSSSHLTFAFEEDVTLEEVMDRIMLMAPEFKYKIENNKIVINN